MDDEKEMEMSKADTVGFIEPRDLWFMVDCRTLTLNQVVWSFLIASLREGSALYLTEGGQTYTEPGFTAHLRVGGLKPGFRVYLWKESRLKILFC